jgi:streptogramin lyase
VTFTPTTTFTPLPHSLIYSFGGYDSSGVGGGLFSQPYGIAVDNANGWVYVADRGNSYVQRFNAGNGSYLTQFFGLTTLAYPFGVAVDGSGNFYTTSQGNYSVQVDNSSGVSLASWTGFHVNGSFNNPDLDTVNSASTTIAVADFGNDQVDLFNTSGASSVSILVTGCTGVGFDGSNNLWVSASTDLYKYAPGATSPTVTVTAANSIAFSNLQGVCVDSNNNVYVADKNNNRVVELNSSGGYLYTFSGPPFQGVEGLAVDSSNDLYVVDTTLHKVYKYRP